MKKLAKIVVCLLIVAVSVSCLLWRGILIPPEDEKYIQDYYHLNLKDEGYWMYMYHGKYISRKSIDNKSVITISNTEIVLFEHEDEETSINIHVSKSRSNFKSRCLKIIDGLHIEKVTENDITYKNVEFNVELYRNLDQNQSMFYPPMYVIYLNYEDVYYCFRFNVYENEIPDDNEQYDIDMNELIFCLEYIINSLKK